MINFEKMNKQHSVVMEEVSFIEGEISKGPARINVAETALHISKMAGLLKIHLLEEDRFLYPNLLNSSDAELQALTKEYISEIGNIADRYTNFKTNYNVTSKINKDVDKFLEDAKVMMKEIKNRISKEDRELYFLAKQKGI
jgi:hemerythrin-like domain-containing protein